ncbi:MAG TPA: TIGR01906 family membrane protein [Nanoarchaeota archaeon]|nr:TIGR01906 family membrane protein [Nanoarchaeota archaeon]
MNRNRILIIIFCIFALLLYLLSSVRITAFDEKMYTSFFSANNIYSKLPDAGARAGNLIGYIRGSQELNRTFFNEKEALHMKDVKSLFTLSYAMLAISMLLCAAIMAYAFFKKDIKLISGCLLFGGISSVGAAILLFLLSLNFQAFFTLFHKTLFTNNLWLMDPLADKIIVLLPEAFFRLAAIRMLLTFGMLSLGMLIAGIIVRWMSKRMKHVCA